MENQRIKMSGVVDRKLNHVCTGSLSDSSNLTPSVVINGKEKTVQQWEQVLCPPDALKPSKIVNGATSILKRRFQEYSDNKENKCPETQNYENSNSQLRPRRQNPAHGVKTKKTTALETIKFKTTNSCVKSGRDNEFESCYEVEKIIAINHHPRELAFWMKCQDSEERILIRREDANVKFPRPVIAHYESKLPWTIKNETNGKTIMALKSTSIAKETVPQPPQQSNTGNVKKGFENHLEAKEIIRAIQQSGELMFWMMWKGSSVPSLVRASEAKLKWPHVVIAFYELYTMLPDTGEDEALDAKYGFERGLEAEEIFGVEEESGEIMYWMKWKNSFEYDLVRAREANEQCPQLVIAFHEGELVAERADNPMALKIVNK